MIHLITGAVNQGKSTKLLGIYRSLQKGDGFYNRKIYHQGNPAGQEIIHLTTGESRLFSLKEAFIPVGWDDECRYGPFGFSREGLNFGRQIIRNALERQLEPIFVDEIGPLELEGKGFYKIFEDLVAATTEAYIVVRKNCINEVIHMFSIKRYKIIESG